MLTLALSIWGALLSTALAAAKGLEMWRGRFRLETNYSFSTPPYGPNTISIFNLGPQPIIVRYWDVAWVMRGRKGQIQERVVAEGDPTDPGSHQFSIEAHSARSVPLDFEDMPFDWSAKAQDQGKLMLRLMIAGRGRVKLMVWNPARERS